MCDNIGQTSVRLRKCYSDTTEVMTNKQQYYNIIITTDNTTMRRTRAARRVKKKPVNAQPTRLRAGVDVATERVGA